MNTQLTIVIPCKNEGKGVIDVVKLLLQQIDCQIIIADSSDDELSLILLSKYKKLYPNLKIVKGGTPSVARNNGAKYVQTPYILFLNANVYVGETGLIKKCVRTAIKRKYDMVTCQFKTNYPYSWVFKIFNILQPLVSEFQPICLEGFMLIKTQKFNELGGFNYKLAHKIRTDKFKIIKGYVYTPTKNSTKRAPFHMLKLLIQLLSK